MMRLCLTEAGRRLASEHWRCDLAIDILEKAVIINVCPGSKNQRRTATPKLNTEFKDSGAFQGKGDLSAQLSFGIRSRSFVILKDPYGSFEIKHPMFVRVHRAFPRSQELKIPRAT